MFRSSGEATFDKILEKATSNLLLEVDWLAVLGITDLIRQKDCSPKYAITAIKKKLSSPNPHVAFYGLQVLEAIVKNCGSPAHEEIATKEFMEYLRDLARTTNHDNVRDKILELIQTWGHAFRKLSSYRAVQDCVNNMKAEGCKFPPLVEADAMFCSDTAPEWQEGECCNRCRAQFGLLNRKHHCRACGQIFCAKCSSKVSTVPKFGIEKEVRVCDSCFEKYGKPPISAKKTEKAAPLPVSDDPLQAAIEASLAEHNARHLQHSQSQQPPRKTEAELKEEEDLALALAISQSEAEEKEREKGRRGSGAPYVSSPSTSSNPTATSSSSSDRESSEKGVVGEKNPTAKKVSNMKPTFEQEDPELARYLDRNYWEQRHGGLSKEDVTMEETGNLHNKSPSPFQPSAPIKEENKSKIEEVEEMDGFMDALHSSIQTFVNRMRSNSNRGRHISNDSHVQSLFRNITSLHSQLLNYIKVQDDRRAYYETLQEKLAQVHDARDALDDLRKDYTEKQRQIAEEAERVRKIQRQIKLQDMRQQKHVLLQQQQEMALRKVQEEERQMQLRIDQQRMGTYAGYPVPGQGQGYMGPPGQMPQGMVMQPPPGQDQQQMHYDYMQAQLHQQHFIPGQHHSNPVLAQQSQQRIPAPPPNYSNPYIGQRGPGGGMQMQGPPPMSPPAAGPQPGQAQMYPQDQMQQHQIPGQMPQGHIQGQMHHQDQTQQQSIQGQGQAPQSGGQQSHMPPQNHPNYYQAPPPQQQQQMGPPQHMPTSPPFNPPSATSGSNHDMGQPTPLALKNEPSTAELISFD